MGITVSYRRGCPLCVIHPANRTTKVNSFPFVMNRKEVCERGRVCTQSCVRMVGSQPLRVKRITFVHGLRSGRWACVVASLFGRPPYKWSSWCHLWFDSGTSSTSRPLLWERERKRNNRLNPHNGCMVQSFRFAFREFHAPILSSLQSPPLHFRPVFSYPIYCYPRSMVKALSASDTRKKLTGTAVYPAAPS
jgi:hypothetical protein